MLRLCVLSLILGSLKAACVVQASRHKVALIAAERGATILLVNETRVADISWIFSSNHIATTWADGRIEVKNNKYKERLYGMDGGSLKMIDVSRDDRGTYTANVFRKDGEDDVHREFHLNVYSILLPQDLDIHVDVTRNGTCSLTLTCLANASNVDVFWNYPNSSDFYISDETLHLDLVDPRDSYNCTAKNPVSSVSKNVNPRQYCQEEGQLSQQQTDRTAYMWVVVVIIAFVILLFFGLIFFKRQKRRANNFGTQKDTEINVVCDKVAYPEIRASLTQKSVTIYAPLR